MPYFKYSNIWQPCLICQIPAWRTERCCHDCLERLERLPLSRCKTCAHSYDTTERSRSLNKPERCGSCIISPPKFNRTYAVLSYSLWAQHLVHAMKFKQDFKIAHTLGLLLKDTLPQQAPWDYLVPMPLHRKRWIKRGFNPAHLIACTLQSKLNIPIKTNLLIKTQHTPPMSTLKKRTQQSLKGVLNTQYPENIEGKNIALVDDLMTTKSSANAAAQALKKAGASQVDVLIPIRVLKTQHQRSL